MSLVAHLNIAGHQLREMQWGRFEYFVPSEGLTWSYVFGTLERNRQELAIDDYSVTQTTLERVRSFITLLFFFSSYKGMKKLSHLNIAVI